MDKKRLQQRLSVLLEIRAKKKEQDDEDELALLLLALLAQLFADLDYEEFRRNFLLALEDAYTRMAEEYSGDYTDFIEQELANQAGYLSGFINTLRNRKISESLARARTAMYSTSLGKLRERIKLDDMGDESLMWVMGENENHCHDCPSLHGKIRKASEWARLGLYPKCSETECSQNCLCHFEKV